MSFTMEVVSQEKLKSVIEEQVKPEPEEVSQLKALAVNNVSAILDLNLESLDKRKGVLQSIDSFGMETMRSSSDKNSLLQISVGNLSKTGDEGVSSSKRFDGA